MSDAITGTGILLCAGNGATPTETFTPVAEVVTLKPPQIMRNEIDVSNHNEGKESKLLGMLRFGQCTGTANWLTGNATHQALLADILANTKRNWQVQYPDELNNVWTVPARVQLFDVPEVGVDAALQFAFALTIDGDLDITADT